MSKFGDEFIRRAIEIGDDWDQLIQLLEEAFTRSDAKDRKAALKIAAEQAADFYPWKGAACDQTKWSGWPRAGVHLDPTDEAYGMPIPVYQVLTIFAGSILAGLSPNGPPPPLVEVLRPHIAAYVDQGLSAEQEMTRH